jgi:RNase H
LALKWYAMSFRVELQCSDSLQRLALSKRVRLVWVPGHCGIHGNEEADALAGMRPISVFEGRSLVFLWHPRVSKREREKAGTVIQITLRLMDFGNCLSSIEDVGQGRPSHCGNAAIATRLFFKNAWHFKDI